MNGVIRSGLNFTKLTTTLSNSFKYGIQSDVRKLFSRNLWNTSLHCSKKYMMSTSSTVLNKCHLRYGHTKTDVSGVREFLQFLEEEIEAERKLNKTKTIPSEVDGFHVHLDGSEVSLVKKNEDETITVNFNVNHSVSSTEDDPEVDPSSVEKQEYADMKSKPSFEVDIKKGDHVLGFTCSFISEPQQIGDDEYNDNFSIDEITLYEGEWKDKNFAVSGDVLDAYLYDLLMNYLEDKGVSNEFVDKLGDLSTAYENSMYINLLVDMKKFISK